MNVLQHLKLNKEFYNMSALEKRAGIPRTMLNKYIAAGKIRAKHLPKLKKIVTELNYSDVPAN